MGRTYANILETVGNTPVVRIGKLAREGLGTMVTSMNPQAIAKLVQAPTVACPFIVEGLGELALVIERPPIAAVVNGVAEENHGTAMLVQVRDLPGADELQ